MIFFKKKQSNIKKNEGSLQLNDSVTGLMNREFSFKEHKRLKGWADYSAVSVRLTRCEDMPYGEAVGKIKEAGGLIARICREDVSRLENGDFILFSENGKEVEERLKFFLGEMAKDGEIFAVCRDELDINEDFPTFIRRVQRHLGVEEHNNRTQML